MCLIAILYISFSDLINPELENTCNEDSGLKEKYPDLDHCVNFLHKVAIVVMCLMFVIFVPIRFLLWRVIYHGWKEQEELRTYEAEHREPLNGGGAQAGYYGENDGNNANQLQ